MSALPILAVVTPLLAALALIVVAKVVTRRITDARCLSPRR